MLILRDSEVLVMRGAAYPSCPQAVKVEERLCGARAYILVDDIAFRLKAEEGKIRDPEAPVESIAPTL
jgi:hypothetical protein